MEIGESVAVDVASAQADEQCARCAESGPFNGYKTKHGALKKERVLEANLHAAGVISSDSEVGPVYPLDGGGDPTTGWEAKPGVFEDFVVTLAAAPHHVIPGKAAMAKSSIEKWTCASKGKIKEDIGYNIDGAQNGIFLPHLPSIYWTKHHESGGISMAKYYGQTWRDLSTSSKESIAFTVMNETWLQMHYTDHDDPYEDMSPYASYDQECLDVCNTIEEDVAMRMAGSKCPECGKKIDKHDPPYEVVGEINTGAQDIRGNITGNPSGWTSWVSPLARMFTKRLQESRVRLSSRGLIRRTTR